ncbi:UNVERIFIED_CONTAM: hypothetical protein GTU68_031594 [Idotea baltica]|nr:hypothetical protein [Idotea baltica]
MGYKAPLLKSLQLVEDAALKVCNLFDRNIEKVNATLGWEQEYFIVDEALFYARPDLLACGRTLLGHMPARGQQLDDHYFGSIPERTYNFMLDLETEALQLGIPISTRHNEVAPGQYEFAPVFTDVNRSVDQNQLFMDLLDRVSRRHELRVLLHEKPFAGLNGSGKHNNWSLATDTGVNLLQPATTPKTNLQFLTFFINTLKAISTAPGLLNAAIASSANDQRLGGNEAPPAIISAFIGETLTRVLNSFESLVENGNLDDMRKNEIKLNIHQQIPDVLLDNTDRNRTSPFAFTGNKFEFRAVGSSASCAFPMTVLNALVGSQLNSFFDEVKAMIEAGEKKDAAIMQILKRYIGEAKVILFEGDNYSDAWRKEAKKRKLPIINGANEALKQLLTKEAKEVLVDTGVLHERELHARYEVWQEIYYMKTQIEGRTLREMIQNQIIPAAIKYQATLLSNCEMLQNLNIKTNKQSGQIKLIEQINLLVDALHSSVEKLEKTWRMVDKQADVGDQTDLIRKEVMPLFNDIRNNADQLEQIIDDSIWPLPKYRELLFMR